ncbi:hypothetical protein [Amycolatopsis benzoatilytica]|uniref:hypothetical protein n=1 Tax=Amycolatopsis benzoatilytica TaxID=346045 RepID=UPI00037FE832|nr:hypothetical protein [Amycolatopsis benzoatilytica]
MNRFLGIYLNDQLALGVLWRELAFRAARNNRETDLAAALDEVAAAIAEDVSAFEGVLRRLGVRPNPVKTWLAVAAERAGRLKCNGRVRGFSPLSRFFEMEALAMGIEGKKILWHTVADLAAAREMLPDVDFDALLDRAEHQRDVLEPCRRRAGAAAFRPSGAGRS